jgi:surface protein
MLPPTIIATNKTIHRIVKDEIAKYGDNADLNHIDVSNVTDMYRMFQDSSFNGDISKWDVSNVTFMNYMFSRSAFDGDLSQWNVSNATHMEEVFQESLFNGDISHWDVSNVKYMASMFEYSAFNGDISNWNISKVIGMETMFSHAAFNGDLSTWVLHPDCDAQDMFYESKAIAPPLFRIDTIENYLEKLEHTYNIGTHWFKEIAKNRGPITANHGVLFLLSSDKTPITMHPALTREDCIKLDMLYQLTGSVYQSVTVWEQQRKNSTLGTDSNVASRLFNEQA